MNKYFLIAFAILCQTIHSQAFKTQNGGISAPEQKLITWDTDPLSPARASFYSAILPGLGQAYNRSYWKIPFVYAGIGTGLYFYHRNTKQLERYRNAYKRRLDGYKDDEFYGERSDGRPLVSDEGLRRGQKFYQRNKEISLLVTIGLYVLNIIEANVNAHLRQFNVDENLTFEPYLQNDPYIASHQYGLTITFHF